MISDSTEKEELILENKESEEDSLKQYQGCYRKYVCSEISYETTLSPTQLKQYKKYQENSCCSCFKTPLPLLIYSIIVSILVAGGIYFNLGRNEGYNAYKELLERKISYSESIKFPDEKETFKLIKFVTRNKSEDNLCPYLIYSLNKCDLYKYRTFCNNERYKEKKCNYMDREFYLGYNFICDENNFKKGLCNEIQYNDYLYMKEPYERKISYSGDQAKINLTGNLYIEKFWINTGNFDYKIYIYFSIFLVIFILFLIYNLIIVKNDLEPGINYYIIITFYLIYYVVFKIYIVLFLLAFSFSTIVTLYQPILSFSESKLFDDPFFSKNAKILFPEQELWRDERIKAIIFCGISLILFIMVIFLSNLKKIIHNYLSFKLYGKNINRNVLRKASIKFGDNRYEFKLVQNKNIYLRDNRKSTKINFREIIFENNTYYLNCRNACLKEQLSWADLIFPQSNILFAKVLKSLIIIVFALCFLIVGSYLKQNEITKSMDYYYQLINLGYKPKYHALVQKSYNLSDKFFNFTLYISIALGILCFLLLYIKVIFGGFYNIIILLSKIFFSIVLSLMILALLVIDIAACIFDIFTFICFLIDDSVKVNSALLQINYLIYMHLYGLLLITFIFLFFTWIGLISPLIKIYREKSKLTKLKNTSHDIYYFVSLDNKSYILEPVKSINLPGQLFYGKKLIQNSINLDIQNLGHELNVISCLEKNNEAVCDEKNLKEIEKYNYQDYSTIKNLIINIIVIFVIISFTIASYIMSYHNNKYYKKLSDFIVKIDKNFNELLDIFNAYDLKINSFLPSKTQFWYRVGVSEKYILISLIICSALYLLFQIISIFIHKNCNPKYSYNNGKSLLYYILIIINGIFFIWFLIYIPLLIIQSIYSIVVTAGEPDFKIMNNITLIENNNVTKDAIDNWNDNKIIHFINIPIKYIISIIICIGIVLRGIYLIIDYLNMNYQDKDDDEKEDNRNSVNENNIELNEKRTTIIIDNNKYNVRIKLNHVLYLQQIDNNKIHKFKKILIENITNNFVYVRLGINPITEQISHAEWNYPNINCIFERLSQIFVSTFLIISLSLVLFECNIENNFYYKITSSAIDIANKIIPSEIEYNKSIFSSIYTIYGLFDVFVNDTIFTLYTIQVFVFLLIMLRRMLFGGYGKIIYVKIGYYFSIFFIVQNLIFILLDFLNVLFAIFSLIFIYKNLSSYSNSGINDMLIFNVFMHLMIIPINIKLLVQSIKFFPYMKKLKIATIKFEQKQDNIDDEDVNFKPVEFKFVSLEGNICSIKEYINPNLQRYLYYSDVDENKDNIENQQNNEVLDIRTNTNDKNNIFNKNYINENKNILENHTNNIEIEMKNTISGDI